MTATDAESVQAGGDTDWKVAHVCKMSAGWESGGLGLCVLRKKVDGTWDKFSPSTDWDDAMMVFPKLDEYRKTTDGAFSLGYREGNWFVCFDCYGSDQISIATTGPLAICRAILVLASDTPPV